MGFSSQAGHVILKTQTTPGVFDTLTPTDGIAIKLRSGSLGPTRELLIPDAEIGGGRDVVDANLGAGAFSGDYEFYARMDSVLTLLNAALGSTVSATDGTTHENTHTVTPIDDAQLPFLSIEELIGASLECYDYTDAVVNTLHLEAEANGFLMGTCGLMAVKQIAGVTPESDPVWDDGPMTVGTNIGITYNGVTVPAKSFSLDVNNNYADDDFRLGSFYLGDLTPKRREVTASFSIRAEDSAMWRQAVYGTAGATQMGGVTTKQQLIITMTTYDKVPGTVPLTAFSMSITIPKYIFKPFSFGPSGDDIIENDVEGQALRPTPGTPIMTAVLKNSLAAVV